MPNDRVKTEALRVLLKIIVEPKKASGRKDAGKQRPMLEGVYVDEAIRIHPAEGDPYLTKELFK